MLLTMIIDISIIMFLSLHSEVRSSSNDTNGRLRWCVHEARHIYKMYFIIVKSDMKIRMSIVLAGHVKGQTILGRSTAHPSLSLGDGVH